MTQWIVLGVAIYLIIGLILAKQSLDWIQKAVERNYTLEEEFKVDVEYVHIIFSIMATDVHI